VKRLVAIVLILATAAGVAVSRSRLEAYDRKAREEKELLYLPNGDHLKVASLGFGSLLADAVYFWAIQYYSDYERVGRYEYVEHIFGDVIPKLDPHYVDPYWLGALILIIEARDLEAGLALIDQGIEANPNAWVLPYLAGWECNYAGQYDRAAAYFRRAAAVAGAPHWLRRMEAGMIARSGRLEDAILQWIEVIEDPASDDGSRAIARRQIRDLRIRHDVRRIRTAIAAFRQATGSAPRSLVDLVRARLIEAVPLDPDGNAYTYDPATGAVGTGASRVLGDR
jgi:tetratricopeptide (TPR) repeat protein